MRERVWAEKKYCAVEEDDDSTIHELLQATTEDNLNGDAAVIYGRLFRAAAQQNSSSTCVFRLRPVWYTNR